LSDQFGGSLRRGAPVDFVPARERHFRQNLTGRVEKERRIGKSERQAPTAQARSGMLGSQPPHCTFFN
jgi:hypothetical protein